MLDNQKVLFIQRSSRYILFVILFSVFILRVTHWKAQRLKIILSDDFDDGKHTQTKNSGPNKGPNIYDENFSKAHSFYRDKMKTSELELEDFTEHVIDIEEMRINFATLKAKIKQENDKVIIKYRNVDPYTKISRKCLVVVIKVHAEFWCLANMLQTLLHANASTSRIFIIFAHVKFNNINNYINDIMEESGKFKFVQIFYPFTTELYSFLGDDKMFCDEGYNCEPNKHKRDAQLALHKHFWWWHVNYVFENIYVLSSYDGYILFLDYEQVISEDMFYIFKRMSALIKRDCPQCDFISLGAYKPNVQRLKKKRGDMFIAEFGSTDYNIGIAFNRTTWNKIKRHRREFCYFNDYRWDESLKYLSTKLPKRLTMLTIGGSRVITINCTKTEDVEDYDLEKNIAEANAIFQQVLGSLYPRKLVVKPSKQSAIKITQQGKWEDVRDHEFCMSNVDPQIKNDL